MRSEVVISIMRNRGWLRSDPQNTRERVTSAARYMMIKNGMNIIELAPLVGDRSPSYIHKKVAEDRWRMEDLDFLAKVFGRKPSDYVQGYLRLAELDDAETASHGEREDASDE